MSPTEKGVVANVNNIGTLKAYECESKLPVIVPGMKRAYVMYLGERIEGWLRKHDDGKLWFGPDPKDPNAGLLDSIERKLSRE